MCIQISIHEIGFYCLFAECCYRRDPSVYFKVLCVKSFQFPKTEHLLHSGLFGSVNIVLVPEPQGEITSCLRQSQTHALTYRLLILSDSLRSVNRLFQLVQLGLDDQSDSCILFYLIARANPTKFVKTCINLESIECWSYFSPENKLYAGQ